MAGHTFELPLAFDGHVARLIVTPLAHGAWHVRTEVDGRVLGWERFARRSQVDHFRARMQEWLTQAEACERRLGAVA
jgi:hypothetical protein